MKRYISFLIAIILLISTSAFAKPVVLSIVYGMDPIYDEFITEYRLYMQDQDTNELTLVATQSNVGAREWTTEEVDIPAGRTVTYFIAAVYSDTDGKEAEVYSNEYKFALRGVPVIFEIKRIE